MSLSKKLAPFPFVNYEGQKTQKNTYSHSIVALISYTSLPKELQLQLLISSLK